MNRFILIIISIIGSLTCFAQRYERSYEVVGLADGDEIANSLAIGIPLLIVGFLIAWFTMWSKSEEERQKEEGFGCGCFGVIIMGVGLIALLPLLTWVEFVVSSIVGVVIVIAVICLIVFWIKDKF